MNDPIMLNSLTIESGILAAIEEFLPIIAAHPPVTIASIQEAIQATEAKTSILALSETDPGTLVTMKAILRALQLQLSKALSEPALATSICSTHASTPATPAQSFVKQATDSQAI